MSINLHYEEKGFGTPLILLHGNGDTHKYFVNQFDYFSTEYRVIAIDTRGHGESKRGMMPFTLEQFAKDLKDFMDSKQIKKAHILGFSDGGNIALIFALNYPQYVDKLIINGANLYPTGLKRGFLLPVVACYIATSAVSKFSKKASDKKALLSLMVNEPHIMPNQLNAIKASTLVLAGTCDLIKDKHTKLIASSIPNSTLIFIKGDHGIAKHNSIEYNKAVEKFLEQ